MAKPDAFEVWLKAYEAAGKIWEVDQTLRDAFNAGVEHGRELQRDEDEMKPVDVERQ